MLIVVLTFAVLLILGAPIAVVLGSAGLAHILALGESGYFQIAIQRMFGGVNSFTLMAIPFFVLAGEIMNRGKITSKLVDLAREAVGFVQGGLAYTAVVVAVLLSAILGSANAVCAIMCAMMVPEMVKDHYPDDFSTSLIASSAIIGPIIPPSVTFVLYAVLAGTSINALFIGGIVPGLLLGVAYAVIVALKARKAKYPKSIEHFDGKRLLAALVKAIPALLIPLVIVGGILSGAFTPTESGAIAAFIAIVAGKFIYRTLSWKDIGDSLLSSAILTTGIMFIIGTGNILGWTLAMDRVPQMLSDLILGMTTNQAVVMILLIIALFFIGMFLEAFAAMIIFVPVFYPIAAAVGIDAVHFGMVFSLMVSVALITPPVGMCLFVSSNVSGVPLAKLSKSIVPFVLVSIVVVLLCAFIPELVTFLPNLLLS